MPFEIILITGTTAGLGLALLQHLYGCGAEIVCINRTRDQAIESLFPNVRFEMLDITDVERVHEWVKTFVPADSRRILCILNAAVNLTDNDGCFNGAQFSSVLRINLLGVTNFISAFESLVQGKSVIVTIGSTAIWQGDPAHIGYHLSKLAVHRLHLALWRAGTRHSIKLVLAGPMMTRMAAQGGLQGIRRIAFRLLATPLDLVTYRLVQFASSGRRMLVLSWKVAALRFSAGALDRVVGSVARLLRW